jgi:hypothetical protein
MVKEKILLRLEGEKVYLTPNNVFSTSILNTTSIYSYHTKTYWEVEVYAYNHIKRLLTVKTIQIYQNDDQEKRFSDQEYSFNSKLENISELKFMQISTNMLLKNANLIKTLNLPFKESESKHEELSLFYKEKEKPEKPSTHYTLVSVPFEKVDFHDNLASSSIAIKGQNCIVTVNNSFLKKEFDPIKIHIAQVLGVSEFSFNVQYSTKTYPIQVISASSEQINRITPGLIDQMKFNIIQTAIKSSQEDFDKDIYKAEELISELLETNSISKADDEKVLLKLIDSEKFKHSTHLKYLAKEHLSNIMVLRFIPKPQFAFLFLLERGDYYFFILETVDTKNATYIWRSEKDKVQTTFLQIKKDIAAFRKNKRTDYIKQAPDNFSRVSHVYDSDDYFSEWKKRLDDILNDN